MALGVPTDLHETLYKHRLPGSVEADGPEGRGACLQNSIDLATNLIDQQKFPSNKVAILYAICLEQDGDMVTTAYPLREEELPPDFRPGQEEVGMRHHGMTVVFDEEKGPLVYDLMCKDAYFGQPLEEHLDMLFETDTRQNVYMFLLSPEDAQGVQDRETDVRELFKMSEEAAKDYPASEDLPNGVCGLYSEQEVDFEE